MVPEESPAEGQAIIQQILVQLQHPYSGSFQVSNLDFQKMENTTRLNGGRAKTCPITPPNFGAGFLMEIAAGHPIGGRAAEDIILILSHTRRREHAIPEIELGLRKSCIAGKDLVRNSRGICQEIAILSLLVAKLIAGCEQQRFGDLKIVLPFNPVARRTRSGI